MPFSASRPPQPTPRLGILNIQNLGSDAFSNLRRYRNCLYSSSNDEYLPLNFISGKRGWGGNPPLERRAIHVVTPFEWGLLPHWVTKEKVDPSVCLGSGQSSDSHFGLNDGR